MEENVDVEDNGKVEENGELEENGDMDENADAVLPKSSEPKRKKKLSGKQQTKEELMAAKILKLKELLQVPEFQSVLSDAGVIRPPSFQTFKEIMDAMDPENRMSPKYIYTVLKDNRYSIYSNLLSLLNIETPMEEMVFNDSTLIQRQLFTSLKIVIAL